MLSLAFYIPQFSTLIFYNFGQKVLQQGSKGQPC